jgi:RecA-family ATPase
MNDLVEQMASKYQVREEPPPIGSLKSSPALEFSKAVKKMSEWGENMIEPEWLWPGFLIEGNITLLNAQYKAGKTTLLSYLLLAMDRGIELAGAVPQKVKVLILSEESEHLWMNRRENLEYSPDFQQTVYALTREAKRDKTLPGWKKLIEEMTDFIIKKNIKLLIIDTLSRHWPVNDENSPTQMELAIDPLFDMMAKANPAVLLLHHMRKSGGEYGMASRGSGALPAAVDIILEFERIANGSLTQRKIKGYSRYSDTPEEIIIDLTDEQYVTVGNAEMAQEMFDKEYILGQLKGTDELHPISAVDLRMSFTRKINRMTFSRRINKLLSEKKIGRVGQKRNTSYYVF